MSAYVIAQVKVQDPERYADYRSMVVPTIEAYGGKFIVRGGEVETLEGDWDPARMIIIEFDSRERAKQWLHSEEYREARALRHAISTGNMIVVEGV